GVLNSYTFSSLIFSFFFSSRRRHTRSVSAFLLNRSSDLDAVIHLLMEAKHWAFLLFLNPQCLASISRWITASSSWKRFCLFVCRSEERRVGKECRSWWSAYA